MSVFCMNEAIATLEEFRPTIAQDMVVFATTDGKEYHRIRKAMRYIAFCPMVGEQNGLLFAILPLEEWNKREHLRC